METLKKVKITVVRKVQHEDLMAIYETPIEHACDIRDGQSWISEKGLQLKGRYSRTVGETQWRS